MDPPTFDYATPDDKNRALSYPGPRPLPIAGMPVQYREPFPLEPANVLFGFIDGSNLPSGGIAVMDNFNSLGSFKYKKIMLAATIPCLTISPSRRAGYNPPLFSQMQPTYAALTRIYSDIDPASRSNSVMPQRLRNKLSYAANYTTVQLMWQNVPHPIPDIWEGPTYNPLEHPSLLVPRWNANEVGYRDPVTVSVTHQFALLPGIGRILSHPLFQSDRQSISQDRVAASIRPRWGGQNELYTVQIEASATFVNEGLKSVIRYAIHP
jgi:hypothetical protein